MKTDEVCSIVVTTTALRNSGIKPLMNHVFVFLLQQMNDNLVTNHIILKDVHI